MDDNCMLMGYPEGEGGGVGGGKFKQLIGAKDMIY